MKNLPPPLPARDLTIPGATKRTNGKNKNSGIPGIHHKSSPIAFHANKFDENFYDFQMITPDQHGIPGLIHLLGMESPGLTSSMAIGEYIAEQVRSWDSIK